MTKDDQQVMDALGITFQTKTVYYYKDFKYERLADAVRYASANSERRRPNIDIS